MKAKLFITAITVLIVNSAFTSVTDKISGNQPLPKIKQAAVSSFNFFRTHRQGKAGITATWGFTATNGVTGFALERTYDDPTDPYAYRQTLIYYNAQPEINFRLCAFISCLRVFKRNPYHNENFFTYCSCAASCTFLS